VLAGASPCGRTNLRIKGWLGRADQSAKVRGLFVHPHQVAEVLRRHGVARGRLVIENEQGEDRMTFRVEGPVDASAMEATLRDVMKVRGQVVSVEASALPNDGKVIEDLRRYR
jgi:phenylacetate-CoA ligase